jgi:hypothetical protein
MQRRRQPEHQGDTRSLSGKVVAAGVHQGGAASLGSGFGWRWWRSGLRWSFGVQQQLLVDPVAQVGREGGLADRGLKKNDTRRGPPRQRRRRVCGRREVDRWHRGPTGEASRRWGGREKHVWKRAEEGADSAFMAREGGEMGAPGVSPRGEKEGVGVRHCATRRRGKGRGVQSVRHAQERGSRPAAAWAGWGRVAVRRHAHA